VIESRQEVYGRDHYSTLDSQAHLVSIYMKQPQEWYPFSDSYTEELVRQVRENSTITPEQLAEVLKRSHYRLFRLLLSLRRDRVTITEGVVEATALLDNTSMMDLLLGERGDDLLIPNELVKTVVQRHKRPNAMMEVLVNHKGSEIQITDELLEEVAMRWDGSGIDVMKLFLDRRGEDFHITENLIRILALRRKGTDLMELLLDRRGEEVFITEGILIRAAWNQYGVGFMKLLLDRRGEEFLITENVVMAAAND
jgi:hypothetical protein